MFDALDQLSVNTIRTLSIDMVNKANSGHPGLPMGAAPMAYVLWTKFMEQNPKNPQWIDRDRFVLSAGHGSALLYSLLHLSGYDVSLDDLKSFRQYESNTPGHPEVHYTDGVETTTGPLGQGLGNAVGMAMAEAHLAATFNRAESEIINHFTYVICGDGDLMEGISHEAASLAGHLKLGKLIVLYDSNDISLDGPTSKSFTEDIQGRFEAYGWQYLKVKDGNNLTDIYNAIEDGQKELLKPTLIEVKTEIGFGAQNAGTHEVHGAPLGEEGAIFAKKNYQWSYPEFTVPNEVYEHFEEMVTNKGQQKEEEWKEKIAVYKNKYPKLADEFNHAITGNLPVNWAEQLPIYTVGDKEQATRKSSEAAIQAIAKNIPNFWGGSADLKSSNNTYIKEEDDFSAENYAGRNIWYGVREFAMGAAMNGIVLHGGSKTYAGTFFVFSDYLKASIRLAALSQIPAIYVFTHDSIAVGEDGPTHEPIEQLAQFRAMPNLNVIRPADGNETSQAWRLAIESEKTPTLLVLTRQNLPVLEGTNEKAKAGVEKGAYILSPQKGDQPEGILIATGSEVSLILAAQTILREHGHDVSVVSMPSMNIFDNQTKEYKESVLPSNVSNRLAVEMGASFGWERYVGLEGKVLAIDRFGASGKGEEVQRNYGFTKENIVEIYLNSFN